MPEVGERFLGTVVKTTTFGAFISLLPGKDGLLHISQIRKLHGGKRIENVDDVVKVGDKIQVEIREIDDRGQAVAGPGRGRRARGRGRGPVAATSRGGDRGDGGDRRPWRPGRRPRRQVRRRRPARTRQRSAGIATGRTLITNGTSSSPLTGVRRTVLPGGLRVITESLPAVRSVALGVWVGVGSRDEDPAHAGATHYLEHLLFKGTSAAHARWRSRRRSTRSAAS